MNMSKLLLLQGATVHTCGPRGTFAGSVLIDGSRIRAVDRRLDAPAGAKVIDLTGTVVTPGFVDAHSHLGTALFGEGDSSDTSAPATPQLQIMDSFDSADLSVVDAVAGGVTTVMLHPGSPLSFGPRVENINVIPGQSAVIKTALDLGKPQVLREPAGVKFALGEHPKRVFADRGSGPHTRMMIMAIIREHLLEARRLLREDAGSCEEPDGAKMFKYGALIRLLDGTLKAHIHAYTARDIRAALDLALEFELSLVLEHAIEATAFATELAERKIPCVVGPILFSRRGSELKNLNLAIPAELAEAGVKIALMTDHPTYPAHQLPLIAGVAVREGLPHEEALLAITRHPAEIIGVDDQLGSLEAGKDADLVIHSGDPLEVTGRVCGVMCNGEWEFDYHPEGIRYDWQTGREQI